ncbi:D-alanine--D-alanine ligase [Frondihabitans sucicola]|uniref:D-alanine--D-alanine ligase n=1 Tax=Frondihabitans sucicola TaxID=1268041 RepID=A0ABN6Y1Y8_9MICO|nr:D-alanine--D-alanine ligase [Frondihabitans sucicola]BDZ51325.1 D-alanine--D-alanine ligase [Frondihabitans sucicola]
MNARRRIAVLGGGRSSEHDVSLTSARSVAEALDPERYVAVPLTLERSNLWTDGIGRERNLSEAVEVLASCDVAVPMFHGIGGEDGTIAALCDLVGLPYVGSGVLAGAAGMDKWITKLVAQALGIVTAPGILLTRSSAREFAWSGPVVVKPVTGGSSHGVVLVREPTELDAALAAAFALDERVLVESVLSGREIDIPVLGGANGPRTGPAVEIVVDGLFDFDTKYGGAADLRIPAPLSAEALVALETAAVTMYEGLGCRGVARIDFFLTDEGPVLNEVNTAPGFTSESQVPRSFAAAGLGYRELLTELIEVAVAGADDARVTVEGGRSKR